VVTVDETGEQACAELLNLDGVFYVFKVDKHGALVGEWTNDETVATEFRRNTGHLAMRVSTLRMTFDTDRAPVGSLKSAVLEFDRAALLALPTCHARAQGRFLPARCTGHWRSSRASPPTDSDRLSQLSDAVPRKHTQPA